MSVRIFFATFFCNQFRPCLASLSPNDYEKYILCYEFLSGANFHCDSQLSTLVSFIQTDTGYTCRRIKPSQFHNPTVETIFSIFLSLLSSVCKFPCWSSVLNLSSSHLYLSLSNHRLAGCQRRGETGWKFPEDSKIPTQYNYVSDTPAPSAPTYTYYKQAATHPFNISLDIHPHRMDDRPS